MSTTETRRGIYLDAALARDAHEVLVLRLTALAASLGDDGNIWPTTVWDRAEMVGRAGNAAGMLVPDGVPRLDPVLLDEDDVTALLDAAEDVAETWGDMARNRDAEAKRGDQDAIRYRDHYRRIAVAAERVLKHLEDVA